MSSELNFVGKNKLLAWTRQFDHHEHLTFCVKDINCTVKTKYIENCGCQSCPWPVDWKGHPAFFKTKVPSYRYPCAPSMCRFKIYATFQPVNMSIYYIPFAINKKKKTCLFMIYSPSMIHARCIKFKRLKWMNSTEDMCFKPNIFLRESHNPIQLLKYHLT